MLRVSAGVDATLAARDVTGRTRTTTAEAGPTAVASDPARPTVIGVTTQIDAAEAAGSVTRAARSDAGTSLTERFILSAGGTARAAVLGVGIGRQTKTEAARGVRGARAVALDARQPICAGDFACTTVVHVVGRIRAARGA